MAGYLNRSLSLSPIEPDPPSLPLVSNGNMKPNNPTSPRIDLSASPLKIFGLAKKKINDIFQDIDVYVDETSNFLRTICLDSDIITKKQADEVHELKEKINGIQEVLARKHMKVVFFGRTSNGKSSVVNAMLQDKILPSGIGHTTNCFVQVEAANGSEAYIKTEDSEEHQNLQSISNLANALMSPKFGDSSLIRVYWPADRCPLLRNDVVLVDSPGIDIEHHMDEWIDKYCVDADVFVLVANAESTLMVAEKQFFHKVSERLSKPNMFILNNRWDASAYEIEFLDKVRKQHMDRSVNFLVDELKVANRSQAENRVFFVSAKEVLLARLKQQKGEPLHAGAIAEGFQARYFEFQEFERKFEECLSKSAVKTKFEQHTQRGKNITSDLRKLMDSVYEQATQLRTQKLSLRKEQYERLDFTQQQLNILTQEVKHEICNICEVVEKKVAAALSEEIRRLNVHVDEFERPFHSDSLVLSVYKKELNSHVEQGLSSNLRGRLSSQIQMLVESSQKDMIDRMSSLIPPEHRPKMVNVLPRHNFEVLYRINCDSLCSDFQEDLEFRFSFGLVNIIKCFLGPRESKKVLGKSVESVPWPVPSTPQTPSNEMRHVTPSPEYLALLQKLAFASPSSQTTVGVLAVGGFLIKTVGWRVIFAGFGIYGLLYAYERLSWTNKARERTFKKQYVGHTTRKLKLILDLTCTNCSHQVQQELSSTFARLCHLVDEVVSDMQNEIGLLDQDTQKLDESSSASRILRNKADYLYSELETFTAQYLQYDQ
ncbi:transmembrane GTPase Marf [Parasteatoda tepidariorum]|uniref:transmembrane GTPase Marf n=1 Tax=Parasteatoda tepidariorum TaxID=114398 RepID=UPI000A2C06E1|nr:transmembrane GTPase Marf [Parasteatoda tepidariorum]XP_042901120.1 transmembrane GTPase Marf [Parasteatoda tepidariorum]